MTITEKDAETICNCMTGIIAIAEHDNNEYTGILVQLALQTANLVYKGENKEG